MLGELHERCLDFGVLSQQDTVHTELVWSWVIQWFVNGPFTFLCTILCVFHLFAEILC